MYSYISYKQMSLLFIFMLALHLSGTLSSPLVGNPLIPEILAPHVSLLLFLMFSTTQYQLLRLYEIELEEWGHVC
jgi:hypothetical protein